MSDAAVPPGTTDVLDVGPEPRRPRRGRALAAVVVAAVLVVAVAVGAFALVRKYGSGLGARPEAVVPSSALAFVRLDLDPQAGQKVNALRFLQRFDAIKDRIPSDDTDLRKWFVEQLHSPDATWADFQPWLGQRMAIVVLPHQGSATPYVVGVLASTDDDAARSRLDRLVNGGAQYRVQDGWVYVSDSGAALDAATAGGGQRLADAGAFQTVLGRVGDDSPLVGYVDLGGIGTLLPTLPDRRLGTYGPRRSVPLSPDGTGSSPSTREQQLRALADQLTGQVGFGVRFEPDSVEVKAATSGMRNVVPESVEGATTIADAPAGALAAVQAVGLGDTLGRRWSSILDAATKASNGSVDVKAQVAQLERRLGVSLPGDLQTLLGSSLVAAVDADGLTGGGGRPKIGVAVKTDAAKADATLQKLLGVVASSGAKVDDRAVVHRAVGDRFLVGTDSAYLDRFSSGDTLGADARVRRAVADIDRAQFAAWVDFDKLTEVVKASGSGSADESTKVLAELDSLGVSSITDGEGSATMTVRLVAN